MNWQCFFLSLILFPILIFGHDKEKCTSIHDAALEEWNKHSELIDQFNKLEEKDREGGLPLLFESIECCKKALAQIERILKDIKGKSSEKRKIPWRVEFKKRCQSEIENINKEIAHIKSAIHSIQSSILYRKSADKAALAETKNRDCVRRFNNVVEVVSVLNEIAGLYEEAAMTAREGLGKISSYPQHQNKAALQNAAEVYQELAAQYKHDAAEWPAAVRDQKQTLAKRLSALKEECNFFAEKGLKHKCHASQKQAALILEQLACYCTNLELEGYKDDIIALHDAIKSFENEAISCSINDQVPKLIWESFKAREEERKAQFFKGNFLLNSNIFLPVAIFNTSLPHVIPIDGQQNKQKGEFLLYAEQFYRFLIQSTSTPNELLVKVYEQGEFVHEEKIPLPCAKTRYWEHHLKEGLLCVPETSLKSKFGLDLRLSFVYNLENNFSMIIGQKSANVHYQFAFSFDQNDPLYQCSFLTPPPWQLETLCKPAIAQPNQSIDPSDLPDLAIIMDKIKKEYSDLEKMVFSDLDQLVNDLKRDPIALAGYVQNEIALVDPFLHAENGILFAPSLNRSPWITYVEKQGSAWEQCFLLTYLLRKAGYQVVYAQGECTLPKDYVERLLFIELPDDQKETVLKYPWIAFFDFNAKKWVQLFPWMKEMQIHEGYDLYNIMPEEYASAHRWIMRYLTGDENILKHIGPDGDDSAGVLFARFVEAELRNQGLLQTDIGICRTHLKRQFFSWEDFPHPSIQMQPCLYHSLDEIQNVCGMAEIEVQSQNNPNKCFSRTLPLARLGYDLSTIHFTSSDNDSCHLHLQIAGEPLTQISLLQQRVLNGNITITQTSAPHTLELDQYDLNVNVKITCSFPVGTDGYSRSQTFSIAKGTSAALCTSFGGSCSKMISHLYDQFSIEKDEKKRLTTLLAFVGAAYFDKCSRAEKMLADLHKVNSSLVFAFGLSKLCPNLSQGAYKGEEDLTLPQVDMMVFKGQPPTISPSSAWHREYQLAEMQCRSLCTVDSSSNEHQVLREIFDDQYAISTVRLLQLAHLENRKNGLDGNGFLFFAEESFGDADKTPEIAQIYHFPHLKDLNLRNIKASSSGQWEALKNHLDSGNPLSKWSYAYMTPGLISSQNDAYKETGTLIISPNTQYGLISSNNLLLNGGLGTPLPRTSLTPAAIRQWQLLPQGDLNRYILQLPGQLTAPYKTQSLPVTEQWSADVRPEHKSWLSNVADPVDTVTGAFYIDEADLILPGTFPLEIRRNYNSQNPLLGNFGCGWKLSLSPFLIEQDGKRFVSELDGSVIIYNYNEQTGRWHVSPEDNPDLYNFNQRGSSINSFQAYIENDVLYGPDGSTRHFEEGLLKRWIDARGNSLIFSYEKEALSRIESSNGDVCGFHYNHENMISEIYAKDGRRIYYDYNSQGDLVRVTLPNGAVVGYDYDGAHRMIRETRPQGKVVENTYDALGRVKEQRSPMGLQQEMITSATFDYAHGETRIRDASGGETVYKIFQKQIYKVIDPLGFVTTQSWFLNEHSWFDPETEQVKIWEQSGGAIKSLKSTTDKRGLSTYYLYDARGNPEEMGLKGDDLTGCGDTVILKKLAYNERNLCIEEAVCGQKTTTSYDSKFPYLPKRIEKYVDDTLVSYIDWEYNKHGQVVREDRSGSIVFWKYDEHGFPCQKTQVTGTDDPDLVTTYVFNQ